MIYLYIQIQSKIKTENKEQRVQIQTCILKSILRIILYYEHIMLSFSENPISISHHEWHRRQLSPTHSGWVQVLSFQILSWSKYPIPSPIHRSLVTGNNQRLWWRIEQETKEYQNSCLSRMIFYWILKDILMIKQS